MKDIVIIGGGLNGLVAGAWLARRRLSVAIVDQRPEPGGGAITRPLGTGYRVPALSHALGPVNEEVVRSLGLNAPGTEFITPDPSLTVLGGHGQSLIFHRDPVLTAAAIHELHPADAGRWRAFLDTTQTLAGLVAGLQRRPPPDVDRLDLRDWLPLAGVGWRARGLSTRELARLSRWMTASVADLLDEWFDSELVKTAIAARAVFGNFAGPRSAGTGWMLLQRLAEDPIPVGSGMTIKGGPGALAELIANKARQAGAEVRLGAAVARIDVRDGRVAGVDLASGDRIDAKAVIAAIDPRRTFLNLVDAAEVPPTFVERIRNIRARGVMAKVNFALSGPPALPALDGDPAPPRGRLLVARNLDQLERAFDAAKYEAIAADPWLDVSMPTALDPTLAPAGAHVLSVCVHTAPRHIRGGAWSTSREELVRRVLQALDPHLPGLADLIVHHDVITPEDLDVDWHFPGGHIFHGEPTLDQSWVARPQIGWSRYRTPVEGLFLGGAGTHPGGGLTGLSGLLAAKSAARWLGR